ncbi:MAG: 50S ribosomal protein L9 [Flavobacteriales bacterium]|nr:50S ribosomal protein L9 [Flavobacteriales bacterium]
MQVILKKDIENLGYKNDVVNVRDGYARNFLLPRGLAVTATESNLKVLKENIKQQAHKAQKLLDEAKATAEKLQQASIKVAAKVGENGKIFGSVNTVMLAEALKNAGFSIERKSIVIKDDNIKTIGTYSATANLHKEVKVDFQFEVVAE